MARRLRYPPVGMLPICPICNYHVSALGSEMHEALITRGEVMGTDLKIAIMVPENCVLVHPGSCHKIAHKSTGRIKCAEYLIKHESLRPIVEWLTRLQTGMVTATEINDAKRFLRAGLALTRQKET